MRECAQRESEADCSFSVGRDGESRRGRCEIGRQKLEANLGLTAALEI